jgi:protein-S-isoprenylcysteine O-methyltransferase Ste14
MNFAVIFLILSAVWVTSELMIMVLVRSKRNSQDHDEGSLKWLNITIYTCLTLAVSCGFLGIGHVHTRLLFLHWAGLCVIVIGIVVRWTAILTLRKFFTANIVIQSDHRIIKNGIYRFVRHPSYSGSIISFFGLGLAFSNWISIAVLVIPITFALIKRSRLEEKALLSTFGEEYESYRKTSWVLFPWLY